MTQKSAVGQEKRLLEERLWKVKNQLEAMAQVCPELRDFNLWQELTSEETELMEALGHRADATPIGQP